MTEAPTTVDVDVKVTCSPGVEFCGLNVKSAVNPCPSADAGAARNAAAKRATSNVSALRAAKPLTCLLAGLDIVSSVGALHRPTVQLLSVA